MTDFTETAMRVYCRNPRCRSKLPAPVSNLREAFCARGCHTSFHLHRCLVCEAPMERRRADQKVCAKAKCRSALRAGSGFGRYPYVSSAAKLASETPDFVDSKTALKPDRAWRIVAGPQLSPSAFHCATIPDGPGGRWEGGEYRRIEAKNRAALKAAEQAEIEANGYIEPEWREVISPDGVKCFVTRFRDQAQPKQHALPPPIPDDLSIPKFLRRRLLQPEPERIAA